MEKLKRYYERKRAIENQEAALKQMELEHDIATRKDFGAADGDVLDIGTLASLIEFVADLAKKKED